jgi:glycosyltransferase involved in cell wall biosynthesis
MAMPDNSPGVTAQKISGGVSVVIPAFNEQENIRSAIGDLKQAVGNAADQFEIIVVDDGSTDSTGEIVEELARHDPSVRLVRHTQNVGYGGALVSGFKAAKLRYIFFTDADRQFDPTEISRLIPYLRESRMVIGYRESRHDPLHRKIYGNFFTRLANLLFRLQVKDMNCAFKIFERSIIEGEEFLSKGALINAELIAIAMHKGIEPVQVAVSHFPRKSGSQTGGSIRVILKAAGELLRLYFQRPWERSTDKRS